MTILYFVLGILLFLGLVVFHEFGHYLAARRNGIEVEEFGIGFPPRAWKKRLKSGMLFSINWLPLGGFVRLKGEHDEDKGEGTFGTASTSAKVQVMLAGVAMNLLGAFLLFTLLAFIGMPKILEKQFTVESDTKITRQIENKGVVKIDRVIENSPAALNNLKPDDEILSVNGQIIDDPEQLTEVTKSNAGKKVSVETKDTQGNISAKLIMLNQTSPYLGIGPYSAESGFEVRRSTWSAPVVAAGVMSDFTIATFKGLGTALKGLGSIIAGALTGNEVARQTGQTEASGQVAGPFGVFSVLYEISAEGFGLVLFVIAVISLTLAIMNALPIPALDGGKLFVMLLYRLRGKTLTAKSEDLIHGTGFAVLILLIIVITVVDVRRIF